MVSRLREVEAEISDLRCEQAVLVNELVRHEALMVRAVMKGHRGLVVAAAG
jgi:hypothetical protein